MLVVYDERFCEVYDLDPAAAPGRIDCIVKELTGHYEFIEPDPATEQELGLAHSEKHIRRVKNNNLLYNMAALSTGAALRAAELAMEGRPAFALNRPPGHHASYDSCWGFCWFNNIAIAVKGLLAAGRVQRVLIVDIDLHYGDGTANIFSGVPEVTYYHLKGIKDLHHCLERNISCDLIAVSAGFDMHVDDWGGILSTEDYRDIGSMISGHAARVCGGRFFAVLEGGYNHNVLGKNVKTLLEGFENHKT